MHRSGRPVLGGEPRRFDGRAGGPTSSARRHVDPAAIARRLGAAAQWPGATGVRNRSWRLIAKTSDFDAWLIAWPGGSIADLHDHGGSRGALHVISGSLVETIPWRDDGDDDGDGVILARRQAHAGMTLAFGAGHVHDVRNEAAVHALSLHVYSPPLTSMIYYDRSGDRLIPRDNEWSSSQDSATFAGESALSLVAP